MAKEKANVLDPVEQTGIKKYKKINQLIDSKYDAEINIQKLLAMSLFCIQNGKYEVIDDEIVCKCSASEIGKMMGYDKKGGSFYKQLKKLADDTTGLTSFTGDIEKDKFRVISLVSSCEYDAGVLTIAFNRKATPLLKDVEKNYTVFDLAVMMRFKSAYSFRLYEIVRENAYYHKGQNRLTNPKKFRIEKSLNELKFLLGIYDTKILKDYTDRDVDYDEAAERACKGKLKYQSFEDWANFRRKVLERSAADINEATDVNLELEYVKSSGRGGKVVGVIFHVEYKEDEARRKILESAGAQITEDGTEILDKQPLHTQDMGEEQKDVHPDPLVIDITESNIPPEGVADFVTDIILEIKDITGKKPKFSEGQSIATTANWDKQKIDKALDALRNNKSEIKNVVGWLRKAIQDDYEPEKIVKEKKATTNKNSFTNFKQRDNDYAELQKQILKKGMVSRSAKDKEDASTKSVEEDVEALKKNLAGRDPDKPFG